MGISRRLFLKAAGTVPAVAATSGASVAAEAAQIAASVSGTVAGVFRVKDVLAGIMAGGGIPEDEFGWLIDMAANPQAFLGVAGRVLRGEDFVRQEIFRDYAQKHSAGRKIVFAAEKDVLEKLRALPQDVPLMDMLNEETVKALGSSAYYEQEDYMAVRELLKPLCSETTTAGGLVRQFESYFMRLAQHALQNPEDFLIEVEEPAYDWQFPSKKEHVRSSSQIIEISRALYESAHKTPELEKLTDSLVQAAEDHRIKTRATVFDYLQQKKSDELAAVRKKAESAWQKKLSEYLQKQEKTSLRRSFHVSLAPMEGKRFVVLYPAGRGAAVLPTRMDWLQWVQSVDPHNARACDVEVEGGGRMITINHESLLKTVLQTVQERGAVNITLPNRRAGFDLNEPQPPQPAFSQS